MARLIIPIVLLLAAACTTGGGSPLPSVPGPVPTASPESPAPSDAGSPRPAATNEGFPFAATAIAGYYETLGYGCTDERPSTLAEGFRVRTCTLIDPDGRTRTVGIVTDTDGLVANGFASISGAAGEAILDPAVVLEPLSAFLGAMLGDEPGAALVPWLAGHLGDTYAQTMAGAITVATYTPAPDDHSTLTVEVANDDYLSAPGALGPSP
jgi:hypothetical protein